MKEMCKDFINEIDTIVADAPSETALASNEMSKNQVTPRIIAQKKNPMDCNTCVIQSIGLAQAFVPFQPNANTMDLDQSLICGTAFADLVYPYTRGSHLKTK